MNTTNETIRTNSLYQSSLALEGGMGAVAWAALEMFRRGGMDESSIQKLNEQMNLYFAKPTDEDCNSILNVLEQRLAADRKSANQWY